MSISAQECEKSSDARIASQIKQFAALGAWCTPEFLIQSSQNVQSIQRVGEERSEAPSAATGRYLASRNLLAGHGQIDRLVGELRKVLDSPCDKEDSKSRNNLLQLWMSLESSLTGEEHRDLSSAVLSRIFPGNKAPTHRRGGGAAQNGGY